MQLQPSLFVSHGAPTIVLESGPSSAFLRDLGTRFSRPRAIVCISAHWETARAAVNIAARPSMIYDFYGFPQALYEVRYPAPGDPALGQTVAGLLNAAGIETDLDAGRGFDHGAWSPLVLMYPDASIPVVELSVQTRLPAAHHYALGRALSPLRNEGVLILGSGSTTHNLRELGLHSGNGGPPEHVRSFEEWLTEAVTAANVDALLDWHDQAPHARRNHPTPEHLLPLFVALGAAGEGARAEALNRRFEYGVLSMSAFLWQ